MMNLKVFFDRTRQLFDGGLTQQRVAGCERLINAFAAAGWPLAWASYGLATAFWETGQKMQPVREGGGPAYFKRLYDVEGERPALARSMGNTSPGDGVKYSGRGDVQLTWRSNYRKAGMKLGVDLVNNPDLALRPDVSAKIMILGMSEGWFTGKKLPDFSLTPKPDYLGMRRIINGQDKASTIATLARKFEDALRAAEYTPGRVAALTPTTPAKPAPAPITPPKPALPQPASPAPPAPGFWSRLLSNLFGAKS